MAAIASLILLIFLLAAPAGAEVPLSVQTSVGWGGAGGSSADRSGGGSGYLVAADVGWRHSKKYRSVLSYAHAHGASGVEPFDVVFRPRFGNVDHQVVLLGIERSKGGPGAAPYLDFGIGAGTNETSLTSRSAGFAIGAGAGFRVISPAQELGFAFELRSSYIATGRVRSLALGWTVGITAHPR